MKYIVMTSQFRNKNSWKWQHPRRNIAIVKTDGIHMPKQIHPNHHAVKEIYQMWPGLYVGSTDKCQFARQLEEAQAICDKLNDTLETSW